MTSSTKPNITIVGAGRVGGALSLALREAGYTITAVYNRHLAKAQDLAYAVNAQALPDFASAIAAADIVLLAVPDDAIVDLDKLGANLWRPGMGVIHHSGLHRASMLRYAASAGALTGTLHPLQSIPNAEVGHRLLKGAYFGLSGHPHLLPIMHEMVAAIGGFPLDIPDEAKPLYHAAAVFASNFITTCFAQAVDIFTDLDIPADVASSALRPLVHGAVSGLADPGLPGALTGPISRGDIGTLQSHLQHLAEKHPDLLSTYKILGQATVTLAARQERLSPATLQAMSELLTS